MPRARLPRRPDASAPGVRAFPAGEKITLDVPRVLRRRADAALARTAPRSTPPRSVSRRRSRCRSSNPVLRRGQTPDPHRAHFRTIEGEEEGFFAWLAVNRLSGVNLRDVAAGEPAAVAAALGALDVGGGSAQIVVSAARRVGGVGVEKAPADVSIASLRDAVYVKSYLGYGATRVESRVKSEIAAAAKSRGDAVATYPCGFSAARNRS